MQGGITQYFDPTVFVMPAPGTLGNVGRNSLRGPRLRHRRHVGVEERRICRGVGVVAVPRRGVQPPQPRELRGAGRTLGDAADASVRAAVGVVNPAAGRITTLVGDARRMQFAVKVLF